jgi:hypothetical protein
MDAKYWEMNSFGQYEGYDENGRLVCVQEPKGALKKAIENGTKAPKSEAKEIRGKGNYRQAGIVPYSRKKADEIFNLIIEGKSLQEICKRKDMPARCSLYKWMAKYPHFKVLIEEAKKLRADALYDEALSEARNLSEPEMAKVAKVKIDTLKWAAGIGNPNEYQPRPKEENKGNIFIIHTGIERNEKSIEAQVQNEED